MTAEELKQEIGNNMEDFCLKINPEDLKSSKIFVTAKEAKIMFDKHVTADKVELMIGNDFEVKEEDGKWFVVKKSLAIKQSKGR